jgi:hypothetical protein
MNADALAKMYGTLTPEERFRLILAASGRGDEAEAKRLAMAGERVSFSFAGHMPYSQGFRDLADLTAFELLEDAAEYLESFHDWDDEEDEESEDGDSDDGDQAEEEPGDDEADKESDPGPSRLDRFLHITLGRGFLFKTKMNGWKLFCERMGIPPFLLWEPLPGFARLQRAIRIAEQAAFTPEGMVKMLNRIRPKGKEEVTAAALMTPEKYAEDCEAVFRTRAEWWGA